MIHDVLVIGGGIVGLATARELLLQYPHLKLALLEKERHLGEHQTGHNSGVIHSGIYYTPGSLKAKLCEQGRSLLWEFCDARSIPYKQVGKLIVATDESELPLLENLYKRGLQNGIKGLQLLDADEIREREPHCRGVRAIYSPQTGIIDYGSVALAYASDVASMGGEIFTNRRVVAIARKAAVRVTTTAGDFEARHVISCAGLHADRVAGLTGGKRDPKIVPFRGDYLILKPEKRHLVRGNIYPVPDPRFPFLGVHFTPRMNGDIWLGPNAVLAFSREGYTFSKVTPRDLFETLTYRGFIKLAARHFSTGVGEMYRDVVRGAYVRALQRYIPELDVSDVLPGPSGVRAQAMMPDGKQVDDFVFDGDSDTLHVRNAPSPAATSALAIAKYIVEDAARRFGTLGARETRESP